jgi:hypothetical protein
VKRKESSKRRKWEKKTEELHYFGQYGFEYMAEFIYHVISAALVMLIKFYLWFVSPNRSKLCVGDRYVFVGEYLSMNDMLAAKQDVNYRSIGGRFEREKALEASVFLFPLFVCPGPAEGMTSGCFRAPTSLIFFSQKVYE